MSFEKHSPDDKYLSARDSRHTSFPLDHDPFAAGAASSDPSAPTNHLRAVSPHSFEHVPDDVTPVRYAPPPGRPPFAEERDSRALSTGSDDTYDYSRSSKYDDTPAASLVGNAKDIERGPNMPEQHPHFQSLGELLVRTVC